MRLPESIRPILEKITNRTDDKIEFWNYAHGEQLTDLFFQLSSELILSELDENSLPKGYKLVAYLFYWEQNCQFSGWFAFENLKDSIDSIVQAYRDIGLVGEANGIAKAMEEWFRSDGDDVKVGEAYSSVENQYKVDFDRFNYFNDYFNDNKELFYEQ